MRRFLMAAPLLAAAFFIPSPVQAQVINPVTLTGVAKATAVNGVYVGPYTLSMPGAPSLDVFCVDFLNEVNVGDHWNAVATSLADYLGNTRMGEAARQLYIKAAWLTGQFAISSQKEWGVIHAAIWYTMTPGADPAIAPANWGNWQVPPNGSTPGSTTTVAYWIAEANKNFGKVDLTKFAIITDVDAIGVTPLGGKQEYLAVGVPTRDLTVTPEPMTMLLVGTGMAGMLGARKRKRRKGLDTEGVEAA